MGKQTLKVNVRLTFGVSGSRLSTAQRKLDEHLMEVFSQLGDEDEGISCLGIEVEDIARVRAIEGV